MGASRVGCTATVIDLEHGAGDLQHFFINAKLLLPYLEKV